jgi:membrane-bound lytic murein transglycosylase D
VTRLLLLLLALVSGACARGLVPLGAGAPVSAGGATASVVTATPQAEDAPVLDVPTGPAVTAAVVAGETAALFGEPVASEAAMAAPTEESGSLEPVWDIDVRSFEQQDRVEWWVRRFTGDARARFTEQIQRGVPYDSMMRAKLRDGGLPEDLVFLALIESGFDPHAYSRAAAVGMWQFMAGTARGVGLRVDWWVDERRDPVRSTEAAVRFLDQLRRQFGSLYLAAAAYNGGPNRVARGLARYADDLDGTTGDSLFFALAETDVLHAETRDYVPKLIAAALVAKAPERYGIRIEPAPSFAYDSVATPPGTALAAVARAGSIPVRQIQELNPHLLRGMTDPARAMYVRVPVGTADRVRGSLGALPDSLRRGVRRVFVKNPVTLTAFARREGVNARVLPHYNPGLRMTRKGRILGGQSLLVPHAAVVAAARSVPDPSIERSGGNTGRMHVVQRGESLSVIAARYGTSVERLKAINGLRSTRIQAGRSLRIR